jgi:hypothetical protein
MQFFQAGNDAKELYGTTIAIIVIAAVLVIVAIVGVLKYLMKRKSMNGYNSV